MRSNTRTYLAQRTAHLLSVNWNKYEFLVNIFLTDIHFCSFISFVSKNCKIDNIQIGESGELVADIIKDYLDDIFFPS